MVKNFKIEKMSENECKCWKPTVASLSGSHKCFYWIERKSLPSKNSIQRLSKVRFKPKFFIFSIKNQDNVFSIQFLAFFNKVDADFPQKGALDTENSAKNRDFEAS